MTNGIKIASFSQENDLYVDVKDSSPDFDDRALKEILKFEKKYGKRKVLNLTGTEKRPYENSFGRPDRIVFVCNIVSYGANIAMLEGVIPPNEFNVLGVEGVMSTDDGKLLLGVRGDKAYSKGKIATIPSGLAYQNYVRIPILDVAFQRQLKHETGMETYVSFFPRGFVSDEVNHQTAVVFDYGTKCLSSDVQSWYGSKIIREYSSLARFDNTPENVVKVLKENQTKMNPHDFGALILHGKTWGAEYPKQMLQELGNKMVYNHRRNGLMELGVELLSF